MTGIINCYREEKDRKIRDLHDFVSSITEARVIDWDDMHSVDCIMLSGSERLITEGEYRDEWLEVIKAVDLPTIGICYGFQIICLAFGSVFYRDENIKEEVKITKLREYPLFDGLPNEVFLPESHQEFISAVREPLIPVMFSDKCIEAVYHRNKPLCGTQFHFERSEKYGGKILRNFYKLYCPDI